MINSNIPICSIFYVSWPVSKSVPIVQSFTMTHVSSFILSRREN
uniref:Uncharacterized protein n=1 Tax=Rhizophora mucronata TaxID=61149 RepID=A0A2P2P5R6_RHIMU